MKHLEIEKKNDILILGVRGMCCLCSSQIFSTIMSAQNKADKTLVIENIELGK